MNLRTVPPALAMQYSFALPADYDMAIVERRIAEKGPALDGWPGLGAKAYLSARRDANQRENLYAPFYVWDDAAAMSGFLTGRGFAGVAERVRMSHQSAAWRIVFARFLSTNILPVI